MAAITESLFHVGKKFFSFKELQNCKEKYETSNLINLAMRDSKTLKLKHAPTRAASANSELRYYYLHLSCTYGGKRFKKQGNGKRETETRKVDCGMFIRLILSDDGKSLDVVEMNEEHSNHTISVEAFLHLPQQRRLDPAQMQLAETLISVRANSKLIQHTLHNASGKVVLLKDIANLSYKLRKQSTPNNLTEVLKQLQRHRDCVVKVMVNEENILLCIFYQDEHMQEIFKSYPEMLLCDATHKLQDLQLAVHIMLAVDGSGQSQIVAMMLLADETRSTMSAAIKTFQDQNPEWTKTVSILTDKDFVEREVFTDLFPNAALQISLYHTLRTFRHEVTCEKMGITSSQREQCLSILQDLAYAADEDAFNREMDRLLALGCENVSKFIEESWEPIRHEWVEGLMADHPMLGECTINGLESINAKMKNVCTEHTSLQQFFTDFRCFISSARLEITHRALMTSAKRPTAPVPAEMVPYMGFLTPFAFHFVMQQYSRSLSVQFTECSEDNFLFESDDRTVSTTSTSCGCRAYCSKRLPCQHVLYVRRWLGLSFDEKLLDSRWTRLTYTTNCNSLQNEELAGSSISHVDESAAVTGTIKLPQAAKYRNLTDNIASLHCEPGTTVFKKRCEILQQLYDSWRKGVEVLGLITDDLAATPEIGRSEVTEETVVQMSPAARKRGRPKSSETVVGVAKKQLRKGQDTSES